MSARVPRPGAARRRSGPSRTRSSGSRTCAGRAYSFARLALLGVRLRLLPRRKDPHAVNHAGAVEQVLHVRFRGQVRWHHQPVVWIADLGAGGQALPLAVDLDRHFPQVADFAALGLLRKAPQLGERSAGKPCSREKDDKTPHGRGLSHYASTTSKSRVISAVFTSIAVAEQYFSCDRRIACSTRLRLSERPRTVQCMWMRVNTLGSVPARCAESLTSQPVTSWPLFLRITTTS